MAASERDPDRLSPYRGKRTADSTPEPFGGAAAGIPDRDAGGLFVVHQHAATRMHWDLRLQMGEVLESWAVPKGPSANPADKRLAVKVEDHPLAYHEFEGVIPEGNYGAGAMIVWDRGTWVPLEDPVEGLEQGKLLFELRGYKLKGRWTLVKIKREEKEWLFIKERDDQVSEDSAHFPADSILSGLTVQQLGDRVDKSPDIVSRLEAADATRAPIPPGEVTVMLAGTAEKPFTKDGWVFEIKYDGYRLLAGKRAGTTFLTSRAGNDFTRTFPDVAKAIDKLPYDGFIVDGEVVVHDDSGIPDFQRLQKRGRLTKTLEIARAAGALPATLYVFDLLSFDDFDVRKLPLTKRKEVLRLLLPTVGPLRYSEHIAREGEAVFEQVNKLRLEGVVAKKADSPYRSGRSDDWLKIRAERTDDFVIVGFTEPKASRGGFGALHLAQYDGDLVYCGSVGTGFSAQQLDEIRELLDERLRDDAPCAGEIPQSDKHHWVDPDLVCEVRFREITEQGMLRHPSFLRFRDDKGPRDCTYKGPRRDLEEPTQIVDTELSTADRQIPFTNLDKIFWPEDRYTKGDLIDYYREISPWLLPFLRDRLLVLTRYPDGIHGKSFYQKDAPGFVPDWIRRERIWSEGSERELEYFVADDEESLLYIANLGTIPLHVWASRVTTVERPDWCVLDLDPKGAPFDQVVTVARAIRSLCGEIGLPCYAKTSGSSGIHVLLPLGRQFTHEQSRMLGNLLAQVIVMRMPDVTTVTRQVSKREGRVYVDYVQNGHGRLIASPYCVRPLRGAPVSAPLDWAEVDTGLDISHFTIKTLPQRMRDLGRDPTAAVIDDKPDLAHALAQLTAQMS